MAILGYPEIQGIPSQRMKNWYSADKTCRQWWGCSPSVRTQQPPVLVWKPAALQRSHSFQRLYWHRLRRLLIPVPHLKSPSKVSVNIGVTENEYRIEAILRSHVHVHFIIATQTSSGKSRQTQKTKWFMVLCLFMCVLEKLACTLGKSGRGFFWCRDT